MVLTLIISFVTAFRVIVSIQVPTLLALFFVVPGYSLRLSWVHSPHNIAYRTEYIPLQAHLQLIHSSPLTFRCMVTRFSRISPLQYSQVSFSQKFMFRSFHLFFWVIFIDCYYANLPWLGYATYDTDKSPIHRLCENSWFGHQCYDRLTRRERTTKGVNS